MSLARPVPPPFPSRRRRWPIFLLVAVIAAVIGYFALANVGRALVYYQTPTELMARADAVGQAVRLGGLVKRGTLDCADGGVRFTLTDNETEVRVATHDGESAFCPREGVGVVVQGRLTAAGTFDPDEVIVKHDENYVAPSDGALPSQVIDPPQ